MHEQAKEWIARIAKENGYPLAKEGLHAVDLGGRETNGHARDVFGEMVDWIVVDAVNGPGVMIIADAATWEPPNGMAFDLVLCAEVFEHTPRWPLIVHNANKLLWSGGLFVTTMAGPGREEHGINHDDPDQPGWYKNIYPGQLEVALQAAGFREVHVEENLHSHDVYAWARK